MEATLLPEFSVDPLPSGTYTLEDLISTDTLEQRLSDFSQLTGLSPRFTSWSDFNPPELARRFQERCERFGCFSEKGGKACWHDLENLRAKLCSSPQEVHIWTCEKSGLSFAAVAVTLGQEPLAVLYLECFFSQPPDLQDLERRAETLGAQERACLADIKQIPVLSFAQARLALSSLRNVLCTILEERKQRLRLEAYGEILRQEIARRDETEKRLCQSEASYRGLFESVSEAIYIQAEDGHFLDVNQGAVKMYGYPREYFIGKFPGDIAAPGLNDLTKVREHFQKALAGEPQQFEFWGQRANGEIFPKEVRLYKGVYFGQDVVIALAQDVTEKKRAEQALLRQLKDLSILQAVSNAVLRAGSLEECLQRFIHEVVHWLDVDSFGVFLYDDLSKKLSLHPSWFLKGGGKVPVGHLFAWDEGIDEPYLVSDDGKILPPLVDAQGRSAIRIPLKTKERWIGLLSVESRKPRFFNQDDLRLFSIIGGTLLTAMDRLRLLEVERQRRREAETLQKALASMRATLDLPVLLDLILTSLQQLLHYDSASIVFWRNNAFEIVASRGLPADLPASQIRFRMTRKWEKILLTKSPLIYSDVRQEPDFEAIEGTEYIRSWIGVPLFTQGDVFGCICLDSRQEGFFTEEQARLLSSFAEHASLAIEKAFLFEAEQRRRHEAETLQRAASALAFSLNPEEAIEMILDQLAQVVPYDSASVQELREGYLEIVGGRGWPQPDMVLGLRFPIPGDNPNTIVIQTRQPFVLGNAPEKYAPFREGVHSHILSWLGVPMIVRDRIIGLLAIDSVQPNYFTEDKVRLAVSFANQAAVALDNARLYRRAVRDNERHVALHRASQVIVRAGQCLDEICESVRQAAEQLMSVDAFVISLVDEAEPEMVDVVYLYDGGQRWPAQKVRMSDSFSGFVIASAESKILNRSTLEDVGVKSIRFGTSATAQSILAVPMRLGERVIGMMLAQSYQPDAYDLEDQQLLEMLAAYAAVAIANVRLYYQLEERLREAEFINRVATLLGETRSITDMVTQVLEETKFFLRAIATAAWVFDSERRNLQLISASGWLKSISVDLNGEHSLVNLAFQTGEILSCQNLRADEHVPAIWRDLLPEEQGAACVPIRTLGEIVGVLMLTFEVGRELSRTEERALKIIAEMVGGAVRRAQLDEQMQRQLQRLASLRVIDMAINTILDLRVILNILLEHIASQLGADAACVMLLNPKTQILSHAASIGFRSEGVRNWQTHLGVDITSRPVRLRSLLFIPDLRETTRLGRLSVLLVDQFVSYACMPLIAKGEVKGVLELFYRTRIEPTSEWKNFLEIVAEQTALAIDNAQLFEELQKSNADLSLAYDAAIEIWSKVMDLRSHEVEGHTRRLADLTVRIATFMGVPESEMPQIRRGALLHDVGMMSVPDQILDKPGPLTEEEWGIIRQHPRKAYEILSPIPQLRVALDIPYCHHERWDGSGYPRGISGKQIPLAARIFAVVDVWDALLSDRPYRKAWSKEAALRYILENSGVLFDPAVVEAFLKIITSSEET